MPHLRVLPKTTKQEARAGWQGDTSCLGPALAMPSGFPQEEDSLEKSTNRCLVCYSFPWAFLPLHLFMNTDQPHPPPQKKTKSALCVRMWYCLFVTPCNATPLGVKNNPISVTSIRTPRMNSMEAQLSTSHLTQLLENSTNLQYVIMTSMNAKYLPCDHCFRARFRANLQLTVS